MKTSRQQITQNITTNTNLTTKLQNKIDKVEKHTMEKLTKIPEVEDLHHRVTSMEAGLQNMKPELGAAPSDKEALDRVVTMEENMNKEFSALRTQLESKTNSTEQSLSKLEHQFKILNFDSFLTGLGETQTKVDDVQRSFKDLKLKLETIEESIADMPTVLPIANDKQPPTEVKSNIQNIEKKHNETVEYLQSFTYSYVEILKLIDDLQKCRSFRELSDRISQDTPIFIEYANLSTNLNYLKCFNGQK